MLVFKAISEKIIWKSVSNKIKPLDYLSKNKPVSINIFSFLLHGKSSHIVP